MTFTIKINKTESKQWNEETIIKKLEGIKAAKKQKQWIRSDLSIKNSNWLTRLLWKIVGKRLFRKMYHVDLENSKSILQQIQVHLPDTQSATISSLFKEAVLNFNKIAPRHKIKLISEDDDNIPSTPSPLMKKIDHGILSESEAEDLLRNSPAGTYIIKQQLDRTPNTLSISYVAPDQTVCHISPQAPILKADPTLDDLYLTMERYIEANKDLLYIPLVATRTEPEPFSPPIVRNPVTTSSEFSRSMRARLKAGDPLEDLFKLAMEKREPECADWLLNNGLGEKILDEYTAEGDQPIIEWLKNRRHPPILNPVNLEFFAERLGYGYKTANLMVLNNIAESISTKMQNCDAKVPPFFPISDFEMKNVLKKSIPELEKLWENFLNSFPKEDRAKFLNADSPEQAAHVRLQISREGKAHLINLSEKIQNYFRRNPYHPLQLEEWLGKNKPQYVIIRSTGREDSDDNTNPGGNKSVPYKQPNAIDISNGIGEVLASYFSENSIMQRLAVGDQTLFTTDMFLPVLIQQMVGESPVAPVIKPNEIFRSGVIFNEDPDKPEVTLIQAGFGNGEGVVTGTVATDTYYVKKTTTEMPAFDRPPSATPLNPNQYMVSPQEKEKLRKVSETVIHHVIREKPTRLVGKKKNTNVFNMTSLNNSESIKRQQAIPDPLIKDIKTAADCITESYAIEGNKKGMDIEYALKPAIGPASKATLYLLQARALSQMEKKEHTYVDGQKLRQIPKANITQAKTLLDGQAYARTIDSFQKILFTTDLATARQEYLKNTSIEVIVLNQSSAVTSHDGVLLRRLGVPVFVIENADERNNLKRKANQASAQKPLIFDPQRSIVVAEQPPSIIKKGLISYSIPLEFTIPNPSMTLFSMKGPEKDTPVKNLDNICAKNGIKRPKEEVIQEIQKLRIEQLDTKADILSSKLLNGQKPLPLKKGKEEAGYTIRDLFDIMSASPKGEAQIALGTLLSILHKKLRSNMKKIEPNRAGINQPLFLAYEHILKLTQKELIPALEKYAPETPNRLFPIKFLEALVFQQPSENVIGASSFASVLQVDSEQKKLIKSAQEAGISVEGEHINSQLIFESIRKCALSANCSENWTKFVKQLYSPTYIKYLPEMLEMVKTLEKLGAVPLFLNIFFAEFWNNSHGQFNNVFNAISTLLKNEKNLIEWAITKNDLIRTFEEQIAGTFSKPELIAKNLPQLKELLTKCQFVSPNSEFVKKYQGASKFGKLALLQTMGRLIETTDTAIKAVSGNVDYQNEKQKLKDFVTAVSSMNEIMTTTCGLLTPMQKQTIMSNPYGYSTDFDAYIQKLANGGQYCFGFNSVHNFPGFTNLRNSIVAGTLPGDWKAQFLARPEFRVEALALGSKADLNFSAHWPQTVEEDFSVKHQNSEFIRRVLMKENGLTTQILDGQLRTISDMIVQKFGIAISEIDYKKSTALLAFHIPIRQHSGSIVLESNEKQKGLILRVEMLGNNEHARWEKGATIGALLGNKGVFTLHDGIPPTIDYSNPTGTKFSLFIPQETKDAELKKLIEQIHYLIIKLSIESGTNAEACLAKLKQNLAPLNFEAVDPHFFEDAFFVTVPALREFLTTNNHSLGIQAAKHTLIGLAKRNMKSFNTSENKFSASIQYQNPAVLKFNQTCAATNLASAATLFLGITLEKDKSLEAINAINELKDNPDVKKNFPDLLAKLDEFVAHTKTPLEIFQNYWNNDDLENAMATAFTHNLQDKFELIKSRIQERIANNDIENLIKLAQKLIKKNYEAYANSWIIDRIPKTTENEAKIKKIFTKSNRVIYYQQLNQTVENLQSHMGQFNTHAREMITESVEGLIGLSQGNNFIGQSYQEFTDLGNYLNKTKYAYIYDNRHGDTTKLRKAGPLYIIQGLESADPAIRQHALKALEQLASDYLQIETANQSTPGYLTAILSICRGYYDSEIDKNAAKHKLKEIWDNNVEILNKLALPPYEIDVNA